MALYSSRLTQDQNLSVHFDGVKTTVEKKKGGLGGRKALNDISRKHNTKNVIPISGRKPLSDLTNSAIPSSKKQHGLNKKTQGKLPYSIAEEGFLHNHDECIKSQKGSMDLNEFLKTIGLDEGFKSVSACNSPPLPSNPRRDQSDVIFEMEEIPEPMVEDDWLTSPSPNSPKLSYMMGMKDYDDLPSFVLIESPQLKGGI